jgi:tetratricopeptide (TPR) repeat protein
MMWQVWSEIHALMTQGAYDEALAEIAIHRDECRGTFSPLFVLEAACVARHGQPENYARAAEILQEATGFDDRNYWVYYNLAHFLGKLGRTREALLAIWRAHAIHGWSESGEKGYEFTHDYFSPNIPRWTKWFAELITMRPIYCLEVGSWQGASATWLLDKVVSARGGLLSCIDTFAGSSEHEALLGSLGSSLEAIFDSNIAKTGYRAMCRKLVGSSQERLRPLPPEAFDFIYIDGAHEAKFVIQDAVLALPLLKPGGYILFDDVPFRFAHSPRQDTARAVEFFAEVFHDELTCIHKEYQMLLQKAL